jgi:hypothetical protein
MKKKISSVFLLSMLATLLSGEAVGQLSLVRGATVNGLGLNSTRAQVIAKFGKPNKESERPCKAKELEYDGLNVWLWVPDGDTALRVQSFEVTDPQWNVSGVRVGMAESSIRTRFGPRFEEMTDSRGRRSIFYVMRRDDPPGNTVFMIEGGKVSRIRTHLVVLCDSGQAKLGW